ncbi:hypothetical protein OAV88_03000 [bacterium]|nr:hypothetical protein [bacterium]
MFQVESDCSKVYVDGTENEYGSDQVIIQVQVGSIIDTYLKVTVWAVRDVEALYVDVTLECEVTLNATTLKNTLLPSLSISHTHSLSSRTHTHTHTHKGTINTRAPTR